MNEREENKIFRKNVLEKFGEHLSKLKGSNNISSAELAQLSEITPANVSRIEKGKINLTLLTLIKLARAFGTTLEGLMKGYKVD
jgi:transcriptional regulator with XRE-family HTH domain